MKKLYQYSASLAAKKASTLSISVIRAILKVSSGIGCSSSEPLWRLDFIIFLSFWRGPTQETSDPQQYRINLGATATRTPCSLKNGLPIRFDGQLNKPPPPTLFSARISFRALTCSKPNKIQKVFLWALSQLSFISVSPC